MYCRLFFLFMVASANGESLMSLIGNFANIIGSFSSYFIKPAGPADAYLNINQLSKKYGYPLETHTVVTEDGYILKIHRMPHGRNTTSNGEAVFLMPGLLESSDSWLLQGPNKSLAFLLADQGYDVWMGNARGNRYTLKHDKFISYTSDFWSFGWEEIGLYDLPAMIDYTLSIIGKENIYYVGYSQGSTIFFVMTSMKPEYNKKIKLMFALAPLVFVGNATNVLLKFFSPAHSYLQNLLWNYSIYTPSTDFFNMVAPTLCSTLQLKCDNLFLDIVGPNNVNESMWPVIWGHMPTGSSTLQFAHFGQLASTKRFCRFDYGTDENFKKYGQNPPPDYDLKAVTSPVVIFYSGSDWFSDRRDVELLKLKLQNVTKSYFVKKFSHFDYLYADEASSLIYFHIIQHIKKK